MIQKAKAVFRTVCRLAVVVVAVAASASALAFPQGALIPSYFYPGPLWDAMALSESVGAVIVNPRNGPGAKIDKNYQAAAAKARKAGIKVLGYVYTSYGTRSAAAVLADIQKHLDWYQVDGIFLDEVSSRTQELYYYEAISKKIRALPNKLVVLNPGTHPAEEYMRVADVIVTFEGAYTKYLRSTVPSWVFKYAPERFCHIVMGTSGVTRMNDVLRLGQQRNAGLLYVTDDTLTNPYDTLPTYWANEDAALLGTN